MKHNEVGCTEMRCACTQLPPVRPGILNGSCHLWNFQVTAETHVYVVIWFMTKVPLQSNEKARVFSINDSGSIRCPYGGGEL